MRRLSKVRHLYIICSVFIRRSPGLEAEKDGVHDLSGSCTECGLICGDKIGAKKTLM